MKRNELNLAELLRYMSGPKQLVLNALFCTAIALFITAIDVGGTLGQNLVFSYSIGGCITAAILLFMYLLRGGSSPRMAAAMALGVLAGSYAGTKLGFIFIGRPDFAVSSYDGWRRTMVMALTFGAVGSWSFYSLIRLSHAKAQAREAALRQATYDKLLAEAELKTLQAQIEPHFLYNTLANVHTLIEANPQLASTMLENLIGFLRRSLAQSRAARVTLADEVALLRCYLDVQKVRMGDRLRYALTVEEGLGGLPFPPMLLQPLVENGVKHGLEPKVGGGAIEVTALRATGGISITVADTGVGFPLDIVEGVGLANVRSRLRALYGESAYLAIAGAETGGVTAEIRIPGET